VEHMQPVVARIRPMISSIIDWLAKMSSGFRDALARHRHQWLSKEVKRELKAFAGASQTASKRSNRLPSDLKECLASSRGLLLTIALVLAVHAVFLGLGFLLPIAGFSIDDVDEWRGLVSDLWQVEASILGLTFVVAVLLIQSRAHDASSGELFQFYIRESYIVPAVVAGLVTVCLTGLVRLALVQVCRNAKSLRALIVSSVACFGMFIYLNIVIYRKVLLLMSPSSIRQARITVLEHAIQSAVTQATKIVAGRALLQRFCDERGVLCSIFGDSRYDLAPIRTNQLGRIIDIDLVRLGRFAGRLRHTVTSASAEGKPRKAFLTRQMGDSISQNQDVLARIDPADLNADAVSDLLAAYKVSPAVDQARDSLISAMNLLKDEAAINLREGRVGSFEQTLDVYFHLLERLLNLWHAKGLPLAVSSTPLGELGRTPLSIMRSDLYDIIRWSIEAKDPEMIGAAMGLPIRMLPLTTSTNEEDLFRTFSSMMIGAYKIVGTDKQNKARGFIIDRSWRYLREFADLGLIRNLERDITPDDSLRNLGACLIALIKVFSSLLKTAMDLDDVASFQAFGTALDALLRHFTPERIAPNSFALESELQGDRMSQEERAQTKRRLARCRALEEVKAKAERTIQLVWFGVSAWLLRQMRGGKMPWPDGSSMLAFAREHFADLGELSALYLQIRSEGARRLGWDNWVFSELPEGEVHRIDTESWMRSFYCLHGLRLTLNDIGSDSTPIVPDRQIKHEYISIEKTCRQLGNSEIPKEIVTETDLERIDNFLELHQRAIGEAQRKYEEWIVGQPISQGRWDAFQQEFLTAWRQGAVVRAILEEFGGAVEHIAGQPESPASICALDALTRKAVFLDDDYIRYDGWGRGRGRDIARLEDSLLLVRMTSADVRQVECTVEEVVECVKGAVRDLEGNGYTPDVAVIDRAFWQEHAQYWHQDRPPWSLRSEFMNLPGCVGSLGGVPVVATTARDRRGVFLADFSALGRLVQYHPGEADEVFQFCVDTIDEDEAIHHLKDDPDMLSKLHASDREDGIWRLRQLVRLRVSEYLDYIVADPRAGVDIRIIDRHEADNE